MQDPVSTDTGVDYGYGVVPYTPPANYTPGSYLDPKRPVPAPYLNNMTQRLGLETERRVVSGEIQFDQLSDAEKNAFYEQRIRNSGYLTPGNVYNPESVNNAEQQFNEYLKSQSGGKGFDLPGWMKPLEWAGSKMYYVYSNYISRPISSMILYASQADRGNWNYGDAWDAAKYTSPGQATWMMFMTDTEMRDNGINPHDIGGEKSRAAVDSYFRHGAQSYVSGITDFAVSWYADPFVIAGRGLGVTREVAFKRTVDPRYAAQEAASRPMSNLVKMVDGYKAKYNLDEATARVARDIPSFFKSKNGSGTRFAEALVKSHSAAETDTILRLSMGDFEALNQLDNLTIGAESRLNLASTKQSTISMDYATLADKTTPQALAMKAKLDKINQEVVRIADELGGLSSHMELFGKFDKMYFNSITTPLGAKVRSIFYDANTAWAKKGDSPRKVMGVPMAVGKPGRFGATTRLIYNGTFVAPIRFVRGFTDDAPIHYIKVDDPDSHRAVTALLRDASTLSPSFKRDAVGRYMNATAAERPMILSQIEMEAVSAMADRRGLTRDTAMKLYGDFYGRRATASSSPMYSTARTADGVPVQAVDKLGDGSVVVVSPVLASQMADSWTMMDFKRMDKLMRKQGPAIERLLKEDPNLLDKIRSGSYIAGDKIGGIANTLNNTWKFLQLARAGYGPRAISDELAGQIVAGGIFNFLARTAKGMDNNFFRGNWMRPGRANQEMMAAASLDLVTQQSAKVEAAAQRILVNTRRMAQPNITKAQRRQFSRNDLTFKAQYKNDLETLAQVRKSHAELSQRRTMLEGFEAEGHAWKGPLEAEGRMFTSNLSAEQSLGNAFGATAGATSRGIITPGNSAWNSIDAIDNEVAHTQAWLRIVNNQIRNDELAMLRVQGKTEEEMEIWLNSVEGVAYKLKSPFKAMDNEEHAMRIAAHVDTYFPPTMAGRADIGANLVTRDLTGAELKAAMPRKFRPVIHEEQANYAMGRGGDGGEIAQLMDSTMRNFYTVMNKLPAERLSRNPLFAQMYKSHLKELARSIPEGTYLTPRQYLAYENAARTRALGDVKRLTFNMDYETRMAHSLRFVAPFFGAQMESWSRWARITADKPQVIPHFVNLYNSPARAGMATTYDGDKVDGYGYATNSVTGEKYKVDKSEVYLNMPVPKAMLSAFAGATGRDVETMRIPVNSLNLVLSGEPAFMPAWGPVVQIPASDFLTGGKLSPFEHGQWQHEDFFREMGVLPYGPRGSGDWWDYVNPASGKRLADSEDEFSDKFQQNLMQIMAEEQWKFDEGLRDTQPTLKENLDRARQFSKFEMWANFVLPFSADFKSPQDFYGDMYRKMVKEDPKAGPDKFRDKYGDSMWMFTAQLSRNNIAMSATSKAANAKIALQGAIDISDPEFAGDITHILSGPYATGDWSAGAYYYQLNSPIQTGGTELQREKLGAIEAMARAKIADGWYQYNKLMLSTQSELFRRGFRSFDDPGAEDLKNEKKAALMTLSDPYLPDGSKNDFFNEEWSREFNTVDRGKYDRFAANLEQVMGHIAPLALAQGGRTDLNSLYRYLDMRRQIKDELGMRESQNINAKSNADLKRRFGEETMAMIERDTRFNELHNRYFSRDMGFDEDDYMES